MMATKNPFLEQFLKAYSLLLNRELDQLDKEISVLENLTGEDDKATRTWRRIAQHLKAQKAVHQGQFDEAKWLISDANEKYGPNALLLIDQASIYYRLGEWVNSLEKY
jgi:hypothetical protein